MENAKELFDRFQNLVVVGGAFGDEGKGKIIAALAKYYHSVARYSGSGNAGHTYFTSWGEKVVSHQIPCGLSSGRACYIGRGVLVQLDTLLAELDSARKIFGQGMPAIFVDEQAAIWLPWHGILETYGEKLRGNTAIGTTGKGVGPMAAMLRLRLAVKAGEILLGKNYLLSRLRPIFQFLQPIFLFMEEMDWVQAEDIPSPDQVCGDLEKLAPRIKPLIADTAFMLRAANKNGHRILAEGAQAVGLDLLHGTFPYTSSTVSVAAGAAEGLGLPPSAFPHTLLVTKILPTRVGNGPFVSEIFTRGSASMFAKTHPRLFEDGAERSEFLKTRLAEINAGESDADHISQYFQVLGNERGATTGRGRSVGYPDIPLLRYAASVNGAFGMALTRLDMLSGLDSVRVATNYFDGDPAENKFILPGSYPPAWKLEGGVEPIFERWCCWKQDISGCREWFDLPLGAQNFVLELETRIDCPIVLIGTGPREADIIFRPLSPTT